MGAARSRRQSGDADDVRDPIGLPLEAHQVAGEAIAEALLPLLERIVSLRGIGAGDGRLGL
jgi:protein-tyrosine phosphatase